jgi:indole-3-glycerol phosphate synthase
MSTKLEEIVNVVRKRVAEAQHVRPLRELENDIAKVKHKPRGFRAALLEAGKTRPAVIAELKKASPSKGVMRGSYPVGGLAMQLEQAGAAALSVLTEEHFFHGSLTHLLEASAATQLPCLRKDFIVSEYQVFEARLHSADAILLIVAALTDRELTALNAAAHGLGLDVLCEVHDEAELQRAISVGADIIGVNSRDLRTLEVDRSLHARVAEKLPKTALRVAESGFHSGHDIAKLRASSLDAPGYNAFLIGESLMKADEPGRALAQLLAEAGTGTTAA